MRIAVWAFVVIIIIALALGWGSAYMLPMKNKEDKSTN